jgi:hypothetical protein
MEAGLGDPKDGGYTRKEKDDDCRPSEAQELLRHKLMGYVLSPPFKQSYGGIGESGGMVWMRT